MEKVDYSKRIKTLRNEITKAETVIEIKQEELRKSKQLALNCKKKLKKNMISQQANFKSFMIRN